MNTTNSDTGEDEASRRVIVVTGASSGIGALTVRALARAGHTVYAGMRDTGSHGAAAELKKAAAAEQLDLTAVGMDVTSDASVGAAIRRIIDERDRIDVIVHNAGHMVLGPAEAFTPDEFVSIYDVNVLGAQRVNRAALPQLRKQGRGLLVWVGSSSTRGGHTPFISPYFAAKAAFDSLAVDYADELIRFGIDTCIVVPGAFTSGTNHFDHSGHPADTERAAEYDAKYGTFMQDIRPKLAALAPPDADVSKVADKIAEIVGLPAGERPFRVHIDPNRNGSEVVAAVADRIRADFYRRLGIDDLLPKYSSL